VYFVQFRFQIVYGFAYRDKKVVSVFVRFRALRVSCSCAVGRNLGQKPQFRRRGGTTTTSSSLRK
jgi:hypothetical protein